MIEVAGYNAMAGALTQISGQLSELSLAEAWNQQGFVDPVAAGYGVDFGVDQIRIGGNKPAISGDTSESIHTSTEADPVDAWHDYVENEPSNVSRITGGIVDGSDVKVGMYSLLETHPEVGVDVVKAVMPIGVPIAQGYTAIAQALGVSMDAAEMDVETKRKFAESITSGTGLLYDAAQGLMKAWWDGVNILFPRKAVEAVEDMMAEEGIGGDGTGKYMPTGVSGLIYPNAYNNGIKTSPTIEYRDTRDGEGYKLEITNGFFAIFETSSALIRVPASQERIISIKETYYRNWSDPGEESQYTRTGSRQSDYYLGNTTGLSLSGWVITPRGPSLTDGNNYTIADIGKILSYGPYTPSGEYPEGTYPSQATAYTASTLPSAGGIALSEDTTEDVVPINLPLDPTNTVDSTLDPTSPTDDDTVSDLPLPPFPYPIPDTEPSNPSIPLDDPTVINSELINQLVEELANTVDPQPAQSSGEILPPYLPSMDDGQGGRVYPSIIPASGSGLIHVYNPTPAEFVAFGNWLWVTYADATIDKIWNNPFDGIIGAFELYCTPETDGTDNIRSGFLVCPTTAALMRQRYIEIDCGTVIVPEFYGNYLDYSPYSQAYIYLPFIGINEVSVDDIVGHAVNIRYRVDTYNGSCIAMIYVAKNNYMNLCYQFAGNCAVEVPLAGGSQAAIKAGVMQAEAYSRAGIANAALSGASAIGAGLATGGLAGALMGGLSMLGGMAGAWYSGQRSIDAARVANKSTVQHSGQFGASHGAMGLKVPHIMIRNPIQVKVTNYNEDYGYPSHKRVIVGGCSGYLRVREVNVVSAFATDEEKMAIEAALKNGVYVS